MNEQELRRVVEAVFKVLSEQGLLKSGSSCGCQSSAAPAHKEHKAANEEGASRVTVGTAGKVFSDEWQLMKKSSRAGDSSTGACSRPSTDEREHTGSSSCPECEHVSGMSESALRALGADRVAVCHPSKKCSTIARFVDHTLLKPGATQEEIAKLCEEARAYCFASVCVNPSYVSLSAQLLRGSGVKICTVVGFPLGSTTPTVKAIETRDAIANGADEIDMVINVGALKSGNDAVVLEDMRAVREAARGRVLKVILETSLLTREEKVRACLLAKKAGADFVKTSTGFGGGGATAEDIQLMRETVGPLMGVKASGGIRTTEDAQKMIQAGATRLGTSASVAIVTGTSAGEGKY